MRKKRGSILIYVMTIFAVLMIMGASLSTLTLQSMKNRKYYSNKRVNLYYSESGIDEAFGVATEYVKSASNYALNETNLEIERIINEDKTKLENIFLLRQGYTDDAAINAAIDNQINAITLTLFDKNGQIIEVKLEEKQDELIKKYYVQFFALDEDNNYVTNMDKLIYDLEHHQYSARNNGTIEVNVTNDDEGSDVEASEEFSINIRSKFESQGIEKIISTDFKFTVPDYGSKVSFPTKYTSFPVSPVWNKGIIVNKTLSIGSAKLNVSGDVYAKGMNDPAILMNSVNSRLIVDNGKVIASEGVKFNYNSLASKSSGAKVILTGGSLYTKSVLFNKVKPLEGAQGATLDVKGSIYVLDDCEIDSENSTLFVHDSYYGVSSGEDSVDNKVDNSSSIIINSEDLGTGGSTVDIGGKVYLAGTAYIKGLDSPLAKGDYNNYYQTGESISIKGNYKAYSGSLKSNSEIDDLDLKLRYELEKTMLSPLVLATHYNKYSKWFTIYTDEIYFAMDKQLKEKYEEKGLTHYKIKINGLKDKVFRIGEKEILDSDEINLIENADDLSIELVNEDGTGIEPAKDINVPKLQENIEALLLGNNNVLIIMTPKGEMDSSLNGANYVVAKGKSGGFNEFIEISNSSEGDLVPVSIYNSDHEVIFSENIKLLSYSDHFENFDVFDKSEYFAKFYEDYKDENVIHNGNGIKVVNINDSIYTGAIISEERALSTNYINKGTDNDFLVRQKKAELKDKLLYMDMFENKLFYDKENMEDIKELSSFNLEEYKTLLGKLGNVIDDTLLKADLGYMITPESLLQIDDIDGVSSLDTGVYISTADVTVLTNKEPRDSSLAGERVMLNNNSFGIIICKGNVYLEGDFEFTGTIITLGNVYVVDGSDVKIHYDDTLVKRVVAVNYDKLKNVFKNIPGYKLDTVKMEVYNNNIRTSTSVPLRIEKWVVMK